MRELTKRLKRAIGIPQPRKTEGGVEVQVNARGGLSVNPDQLLRSPKAQERMKEVARISLNSRD